MTENSLLIRSRRRAKALPPASEADCDAADLKNGGSGRNLGPSEASIWRMSAESAAIFVTKTPHASAPGRPFRRSKAEVFEKVVTNPANAVNKRATNVKRQFQGR